MPCGKKPLVKNWDRPRNIRIAKPSRYEKNEACVKEHWKNVIKELELSYKDDRFWESQSEIVRDLVGPVIFERLAKIFGLQLLEEPYVPRSEPSLLMESEQFYVHPETEQVQSTSKVVFSKKSRSSSFFVYDDEEEEEEEEEIEEEESWEEPWSLDRRPSKEAEEAKESEKAPSYKSLSKLTVGSKANFSRTFNKSAQKSFSSKYLIKEHEESDASAFSGDDLLVTVSQGIKMKLKGGKTYNPHFELLFCSETEADMITWESKYLKKTLEVSASDEYSKKAELLTKQICHDFYNWWISIGSSDYKSEVNSPADLESLFQIWFDEHASRGLVLDPKTLPCVLSSIANICGVPHAACPRALKRQIAWDIRMETMPAHTTAFNSSLPQKAKHIPPKNRTAEMWRGVEIPEDLKSMTAIWGDIAYLTSTKEFKKWLDLHPRLPVPPCLQDREQYGDKKQLFVVPSDFIFSDGSSNFSSHGLNIPVSQFSMEIKEVLSKLLRD